jgi:hypothetical protein
MSKYAWIITRDCLHDASPEFYAGIGCSNRAGTVGPRNATPEQIAALKSGKGETFKMYDDDGDLYYTGRFLGDSRSEDALGPLDDFGSPDAGCTEIRFARAGGVWESI